MNDILPFHGYNICPKCTGTIISRTYDNDVFMRIASSPDYPAPMDVTPRREWLQCRCVACGYQWREATADQANAGVPTTRLPVADEVTRKLLQPGVRERLRQP